MLPGRLSPPNVPDCLCLTHRVSERPCCHRFIPNDLLSKAFPFSFILASNAPRRLDLNIRIHCSLQGLQRYSPKASRCSEKHFPPSSRLGVRVLHSFGINGIRTLYLRLGCWSAPSGFAYFRLVTVSTPASTLQSNISLRFCRITVLLHKSVFIGVRRYAEGSCSRYHSERAKSRPPPRRPEQRILNPVHKSPVGRFWTALCHCAPERDAGSIWSATLFCN